MKWLDLIPSWAYALAVLALTALSVWLALEASADRVKAAHAQTTLATERLGHQKAMTKQALLVLKVTGELTTLQRQQEKRDGDAQATIAALGEDLRRRSRSAGGPGLRDPFAVACREPAPGPRPAAVAGGEDPAEAGGLLSAELEGLLLRLEGEADEINAAYSSCRADAITVRAKIRELQHADPQPTP
jgi:hypothetical protein